MKKNLFIAMLAVFGIFAAASCTNDELDIVQDSDLAQVTFSLGVEGQAGTKATISDGTKADKLVYTVYDSNGNALPVFEGSATQKTDKIGDITETPHQVTITLAKGQTYQVAFWAQDADCKAYDTEDLKAVKVSYKKENSTDNAVNNDELRDAFFKTIEFEVNGNKTIDVVLKRPFAQINVGVEMSDWNAAVASGVTIKESAVVIKNAANQINLLTGEVSGNETVVTYVSNAIPEETLYVDTDITNDVKEAYKWLSMSYILVAENGDELIDGMKGANKTTLQGLQYTFTPYSGSPIEFSEGLNSVPVQRNWRTNILGKILTGDIQFNITIDEEFDGDYIYPDNGTIKEQLEFVATFGGTVTLTSDVTLDGPLNVKADMVLNIKDGSKLTGSLNVAKDAKLTVNGGTIENTDDAVSGIISNGDLTLNNVEINSARHALRIESGNVVINGGTYKVSPISKKTLHALNVGDDNTVANVIIKDGTFIGPKGTIGDSGAAVSVKSGSTVTIEGGDFSMGKNNTLSNKGTLTITGGSFDQDPTAYVAEDFKAVKSGDKWYVVAEEVSAVVSTSEDMAEALKADNENINVVLACDIDLPIKSLGEMTGGSGEYKLGGVNTKNIVIDLNGKKLNITTTYWSNLGAKNNAALFTIKNGTMTSSQATGTWNSYDLTFSNCDYAFEDVVFDKAIAFDNSGKSVSLKNVTINEAHDYYAMWITASGQTVTIDGMTINSSGRGIKIDEEYVDTPAKVTLNINNVTFKTTKKAAIMVMSEAGAEINASNLNIKDVNADNYFAVWVDEDAAQFADKVIVNGAQKAVEGRVLNVASPEELANLTTIKDNSVIFLEKGNYIIPSSAKGKTFTIKGTGNPEDVSVAVTKVGTGGENCDYGLDGSKVTFDGITITTNSSTYIGYARCNGTYKNCVINGTYTLYGDSVFENCTFNVSGDVYNIWTWGAPTAKFDKCTFNSDGKAVLLYGTVNTKLTIENSVFYDKGGLTDKKAAIEIGNDYNKSYELIVNNTIVNGYEINDKGINTGTTLWGNKNSMGTDKLNVVVDGVDVY